MKRAKKSTFFIVVAIIGIFTYLTFFGASNYFGDKRIVYIKGANDIRWGIDIQGGVEAVYMPDLDPNSITAAQMTQAEDIIRARLVGQNITDSEIYTDAENKQVIVRFPWQSGESNFDPTTAVQELGKTSVLKFCEGETSDTVILQGSADIQSAEAAPSQENPNEWQVNLTLTANGATKFEEATRRLVNTGKISIWMDDTMIQAPDVNAVITDGNAIISGGFDAQSSQALASQINSGALPFNLTVDDSKLRVISPTLGEQALDIMMFAGIIAFALVCVIMIMRYRLPGLIACIALMGQVAGMIACVSGFFSTINSFTLTIPGIAGIILSIGMGVDANVITAERIREELRLGKTIDGSIDSGYDNGFSAILDGNVTVIIISIILMGAFGPSTSIMAKILSPVMFMFSSSITGTIYSFGYTLLTGVIFNFIMGVTASRWMLKSFSRFKAFRKPWLYGGEKNA